MNALKTRLLCLIIILSSSVTLPAQEKDAAEIQKMIDSKNFVFKAQSTTPQSGRTRQLTYGYDFVARGDTIICFLPYYGRSYSAPVDTDGGIKFTSTDFSYEAKKLKKSWVITIKPKDADDVRELYFTAFANGNASLQVTSNNRSNISFNGYLEKGKEVEKKAF